MIFPDCHRCAGEVDTSAMSPGEALMVQHGQMILCPDCGNKRCPKASDHRLACSDSNEPGQSGSVYQ